MKNEEIYAPVEGFTYALNRAVKGRKNPVKKATNLLREKKSLNDNLILLFFDSFLGSNFSKENFLKLIHKESVTILTLKACEEKKNLPTIISLFGNDNRSIINANLGKVIFKERKTLDYEILIDKFLEIYELKPSYIFLDSTTLRTENNPFYSYVLELFAVGFALTLLHRLENSVLELVLTEEVYNAIRENLENSFFVNEFSNESKNCITLLVSPYVPEEETEPTIFESETKEKLVDLLFLLPAKPKVKKKKLQPLKKVSFEKLFNAEAFVIHTNILNVPDSFQADKITKNIKIISRHHFNSWLVNKDFFRRIKDSHVSHEIKFFLYKKYGNRINSKTFQILRKNDFLISIRKNTFNIVYILEAPEHDNSLYIPNSKLAKFSPTPFLKAKINPIKLAIILSPLTNKEFNKTISLNDAKQFIYEVTNLALEQRLFCSQELLEAFYSTNSSNKEGKENSFQKILKKYFK